MKLKSVALLVLIFCASQIYSQQFYVKLNGGYGLGTSPREFNSNSYAYTENGPSTNVDETVSYSFGKGMNLGGALGYFITSNIGVEVEYNYSQSSELSLNNMSTGSQSNYKSAQTISSKASLIIPSVFISIDMDAIKPYMKIGPVICFPVVTSEMRATFVIGNPASTNSYESEIQYDGGLAVGINSALGIVYEIANNFNFVFEVSNKNISYSPERGKVEKVINNGRSVLDQLTTYEREIEFKEKVTQSGEPDFNKPYQATKVEYPFSSLAFSVGISFVL